MSDATDLRDQIAEALRTERWGVDHWIGEHRHHGYHGSCSLCQGDADAIINIVMGVVQPVIAHYERLLAEKDDEIDDKSDVGAAVVAAWKERAEQAEATIERVRVLARQARGVSGALCTCRECESEDWNPEHEPHEPTWTGWNLNPADVLAALDQEAP